MHSILARSFPCLFTQFLPLFLATFPLRVPLLPCPASSSFPCFSSCFSPSSSYLSHAPVSSFTPLSSLPHFLPRFSPVSSSFVSHFSSFPPFPRSPPFRPSFFQDSFPVLCSFCPVSSTPISPSFPQCHHPFRPFFSLTPLMTLRIVLLAFLLFVLYYYIILIDSPGAVII